MNLDDMHRLYLDTKAGVMSLPIVEYFDQRKWYEGEWGSGGMGVVQAMMF